jgi:hypothetical protein
LIDDPTNGRFRNRIQSRRWEALESDRMTAPVLTDQWLARMESLAIPITI